MPSVQPRWLVGKTVARVDMNPFPDGRGGVAHSPVITFTDGSCARFVVEETDTADYGVAITYTPARRRA